MTWVINTPKLICVCILWWYERNKTFQYVFPVGKESFSVTNIT